MYVYLTRQSFDVLIKMVSDGVQCRRKEEVSSDSRQRAYQTQINQIYQNRCSNIPYIPDTYIPDIPEHV